ncbi:Uncharacterised protein [Shigella dysenteriae]|nr:Uncharacterised protein [Shigella dysenteriae]
MDWQKCSGIKRSYLVRAYIYEALRNPLAQHYIVLLWRDTLAYSFPYWLCENFSKDTTKARRW